MDEKTSGPPDREFDICARCGGVLFEGVPMYLVILCVPCRDLMITRQLDPGYRSWQQRQHMTTCHHVGDAHGQHSHHNEGPVRCSSPKLNFMLGMKIIFQLNFKQLKTKTKKLLLVSF